MQIRSGGRWSAAFACVFMLAGSAAAADPAPAIDALRDIAGRVDAATREALAAHAGHRAVAPRVVDATKRARAELDAIARAMSAQGFATNAAYARKQQQVARLLANLERVEAAAADAAVPALVATADPEHTARVALSAARGATCASALTIATGAAVETDLAGADAEGSTLWLRIAPSKARFVRIDTAPTPLDTEITVFGAACPSADKGAIARNDDAFGLGAAVVIDSRQSPGFHYARVRNLARKAGAVIARVDGTGAIVGRVTDARNGHPINANVIPISPDGYFSGGAQTDGGSGLYLLSVDPGTYYVSVASNDSTDYQYVAELYPDAPCSTGYVYSLDECDVADATALTITDGQELAGIDVATSAAVSRASCATRRQAFRS